MVLESTAQKPLSQDREQHSSFLAHEPPKTLQITPPQTLAWHASEQQSCEPSQWAPSAAQ